MGLQDEIDARVQSYYAEQFDEGQRLSSMLGRVEFERTQEIIGSRLEPGARILDVGGATGVHAVSLADAGHDVTLIDPVVEHVEIARRSGTVDARVGDARRLEFEDDAFDAVLLLGPLYHLASREDRLQSLREASRVLRTGGSVFAAVIPRLARYVQMRALAGDDTPDQERLVELLRTGAPTAGRFPGAHFHTSGEIEGEVRDAGFSDVSVVGLEGPAGLGLQSREAEDDELHQAAMLLARRLERVPSVRDMSPHLLAIATA